MLQISDCWSECTQFFLPQSNLLPWKNINPPSESSEVMYCLSFNSNSPTRIQTNLTQVCNVWDPFKIRASIWRTDRIQNLKNEVPQVIWITLPTPSINKQNKKKSRRRKRKMLGITLFCSCYPCSLKKCTENIYMGRLETHIWGCEPVSPINFK